jgi:hypothetical protein
VIAPEAAESWCPKCNDWSLVAVGDSCLWCDDSGRIAATRTVALERAKPWLRLPVEIRYPNLVNRVMVA